MSDTYHCQGCHQTFLKAWSDEEALAEAAQNFPALTADDIVVLCEDCHREFMAWAKAKGLA